MRRYFFAAAIFVVTIAAAPAANVFDQIATQLQEPLKALSAQDAAQKTLDRSTQDQIDFNSAAAREQARLDVERPPVQRAATAANDFFKSIIASGCPTDGGEYPASLVDRCQPLINQHDVMSIPVRDQLKSLSERQNSVNQIRANVAATTLANVAKQKEINAERDRQIQLRNALQDRAVGEAIRSNKLAAGRACGTNACCHKVVYDGAAPKLCGVTLVCGKFQGAGLFGEKRMICTPSAKPSL